MDISLSRALAWRLDRHFLRAGSESAVDVVRRLCGVPAWSGDPDLAIRRRIGQPVPDAEQAALESGEVIRTYAYRGATHLLAAEHAGVYMAVRGGNRQWLLPSWRRHYDLEPSDWDALRETVRAAVAGRPISRTDLIRAVAAEPRFSHLGEGLHDPSHTLLKAFAWQGDLCFGPPEDGEPTYRSPAASPYWTGLPDVDEAGRRAVVLYLAGYGPATRDNVHHWLVAGLSAGRRRLDRWLADLNAGQITEVRVDGQPMLHLTEHLETLARSEPGPDEVVLLPGYDQWVLGPGTADERVVPAEHRQAISRGANLLLHGGRVAGTWKIHRASINVSWSTPDHAPPAELLQHEIERLAVLLGRDLTMTSAANG